MQINPPFGYTDVVPLLKTHRVRLLRAGEVPPFVRTLNAIPISFTEFAPAARDYPVVFTSGDGGKTYAPVAVLGMNAGENLFSAADAWAQDVYVPAYARRYPFCMAKVKMQDGIDIETAVAHINALERKLKQRVPKLTWCFIEPDVSD